MTETLTDLARLEAAHVVQQIRGEEFCPTWAELKWLGERLVVAARHMEAVESTVARSRREPA